MSNFALRESLLQCINAFSPTSPVSSKCAVFSRVSGRILSLHFGLVYFGQSQAETVEQNLLVVAGGGDAATAKFSALASRQDHVHHSQLAEFREHTAWFVTQTRLLAQLTQRFPQECECAVAGDDEGDPGSSWPARTRT